MSLCPSTNRKCSQSVSHSSLERKEREIKSTVRKKKNTAKRKRAWTLAVKNPRRKGRGRCRENVPQGGSSKQRPAQQMPNSSPVLAIVAIAPIGVEMGNCGKTPQEMFAGRKKNTSKQAKDSSERLCPRKKTATTATTTKQDTKEHGSNLKKSGGDDDDGGGECVGVNACAPHTTQNKLKG